MTESTQLQATENNNTGVVKMEPPPVSPSPSEQQYALKWNDFQSSILSSFRHLRDEEDFVDVTLACDQRSFTAHKVVLSACSPYFRKLLKANPCEHPIVILRDVRAEDVENLLRFMYNGEVNIGHEQLSDFLKTAQLLQVRGLADVNGPTSRTSASTVNSTLSSSTPAVQELKASPTSTSLPWELSDDRSNHLTPPPQKRIKSADLYRAQHGISPERLLLDRELPVGQHPLHRERDRNRERDHSRETSRDRDRDRSLELRDTLLGQALEGGQQLPATQKHQDLASLQAQSTGEDSNSSDTEPSDRGDGAMDGTMDSMNGSVDNQRSHSFPSAFLGLQGIPGLLPGPSGIHGADNFGAADTKMLPQTSPHPACIDNDNADSYNNKHHHLMHHLHHDSPDQSNQLSSPTSQSLAMIRILGAHLQSSFSTTTTASTGPSSTSLLSSSSQNGAQLTNPKPDFGKLQNGPQCPHCGKIYSNASNLRQHVRNVHMSVEKSLWHSCPTCGKKLKTKHYLINHQLQAHGIHQRVTGGSNMQYGQDQIT